MSGTGYAGSFYVKNQYSRNSKSFKCLCLFICFSTRAIHLELMSDFTAFTRCEGLCPGAVNLQSFILIMELTK